MKIMERRGILLPDELPQGLLVLWSKLTAVLEMLNMLDSIHHGTSVEVWALTKAFGFEVLFWSTEVNANYWIATMERVFPVVFSGPTARKTSTSWASGLGIILETLSEWNICASGTLKMKRCRVGCRRPRSCTSHFRLSTWHFTHILPSTIYTWKFTDRFYTLRLKLHIFYALHFTFHKLHSTFHLPRFLHSAHSTPRLTLDLPRSTLCLSRSTLLRIFTRHAVDAGRVCNLHVTFFYVHLNVHVHVAFYMSRSDAHVYSILVAATSAGRVCDAYWSRRHTVGCWHSAGELKPQTHRWLLEFSCRIEAADTPVAAGIQLQNWSCRHTVGCWHSAAELKPQTHPWLLAFSCRIEAADTPLAAGI